MAETDLISRQAAFDMIGAKSDEIYKTKQAGATFPHDDLFQGMAYAADIVKNMPSAQPETCEGCKHLGKWENEAEYGYPSPCTRCEKGVEDHYER